MGYVINRSTVKYVVLESEVYIILSFTAASMKVEQYLTDHCPNLQDAIIAIEICWDSRFDYFPRLIARRSGDVPFLIRPPPMDERFPTSRVWPSKDSYQSSMA